MTVIGTTAVPRMAASTIIVVALKTLGKVEIDLRHLPKSCLAADIALGDVDWLPGRTLEVAFPGVVP